jgi:hypothetical protein
MGPFGHGVRIAAGADVEIRDSLVAAVWGTGVAVSGATGGSGPVSRLYLVESEARNCYHRCVTIGPNCNSTVIERCRISGSAWHGIRYDHAAPTITGNALFGNARFGIYASGRTTATVRGNLFGETKWRSFGASVTIRTRSKITPSSITCAAASWQAVPRNPRWREISSLEAQSQSGTR